MAIDTKLILRLQAETRQATAAVAAAVGQINRDVVRMNARQLRGAGGMVKAWQGVGQQALRVRSIVGDITGMFLRIGTVGLGLGAGAAGLGIAGVVNLGQTQQEFEDYAAVLETLEGSAAKARESLAWTTNFAAKTPYEIGEVTDAFVRLRAYGVDPTQGALRILGDTAAAFKGKSVTQAVEALADAMVLENERLKEFGVKASVSGSKVTYTYRDNEGKQQKVSTNAKDQEAIQDTLLGIFENRFQGSMERKSKTLGGMLSNLADQFTLFKLRIVQSGLGETIKKHLGEALDWFDRASKDGTLDDWANQLGTALDDTVTSLRQLVPELLKSIREGWPDFRQGALEAWEGAKDFAAGVREVWTVVRNVTTALGGWTASVKLLFGAWAAFKGLQLAVALGGVAQSLWAVVAATRAWAAAQLAVSASSVAAGTGIGFVGGGIAAALGGAATLSLGTAAAAAGAGAVGYGAGRLLANVTGSDDAIAGLIGRLRVATGGATPEELAAIRAGILAPGGGSARANERGLPGLAEGAAQTSTGVGQSKVLVEVKATNGADAKVTETKQGKGGPKINAAVGKQATAGR